MGKHIRDARCELDDPWLALAAAVVRTALDDYRRLLKRGGRVFYSNGERVSVEGMEEFFRSPLFGALSMGTVDPFMLARKPGAGRQTKRPCLRCCKERKEKLPSNLCVSLYDMFGKPVPGLL